MIGRKLSHYEIVDEVSRGGMGVVYRAVDVNLGREVALKVLPDDLAQDSDRRQRLLQEARAASALEHPHIAVIHEVGEADGVTFIAMELIRGEKLSEVTSRGPLPQARALALATDIAEGLARAHERGIVHRDLKPANVIVTSEGHAKIIDFGLAKHVVPVPAESATATIDGPATGPGVIMGTAAYMSPEQARGARVDHRSDIFALGVTLYEMLTGRPAFQGQSNLDTLQAVLSQPVPPLPAVGGTSSDAMAELQRIIAKATAKDPEDRYQGMKDVVVDLRAAWRRLESAPMSAIGTPTPAHPGRRRPLLLGAAVVAILVAGGASWWWTVGRDDAPARSTSGKPSVAVLYFENNTGDASLDWMRNGLTDMIVTDLSQSADIEVLGTDRLVQILRDLDRADDRVLSAQVVEEIADRAAVDTVVLGSYVRAGDTIRISARLQDARTGQIRTAERVEGVGEESLFTLVDELTRRLRSKMAAAVSPARLFKTPGDAPRPGLEIDRELKEVTTSSIPAYRYYVAGIDFHHRGLSEQAAPLFERAIQIDPEFAMAHAKLAVVNYNMRQLDKSDAHAKRALDLATRLTARERHYIEGFYYTRHPETLERGLDAYRQGLALHPEHQASRHNLALHLMQLERYDEALEHHEALVERGTTNPTTYENLARMLVETDNLLRARAVADDYVRRFPDNAVGARMLGAVLIAQGQLDEARRAFDSAMTLNPLDFSAIHGKRTVALLEQEWEEAAKLSETMDGLPASFPRMVGLIGAAQVTAARGRGRETLDLVERAIRLPDLAAANRTAGRSWLARTLLMRGQPRPALAALEAALPDAAGEDAEFGTLRLLAVAQAMLGRTDDAARTVAQLEERARQLPSEVEMRTVHWARGELALIAGDPSAAVAQMTRALSMLPPHGPATGPPSSHGDLWFSAALANLKAGRDADAAALLERLQRAHERAFAMEPWARSFYLLGQIYERRGDAAKAREQYATFVDLWGDGDLERGWVEEARRKAGR